MRLIDKYNESLNRLENGDYTSVQRKKRDVLTLKSLIKRYRTYEALKKQCKAYQQAIARFNVDYSKYAYELQGYVLEEQSKLNKENK